MGAPDDAFVIDSTCNGHSNVSDRNPIWTGKNALVSDPDILNSILAVLFVVEST